MSDKLYTTLPDGTVREATVEEQDAFIFAFPTDPVSMAIVDARSAAEDDEKAGKGEDEVKEKSDDKSDDAPESQKKVPQGRPNGKKSGKAKESGQSKD